MGRVAVAGWRSVAVQNRSRLPRDSCMATGKMSRVAVGQRSDDREFIDVLGATFGGSGE